METPQKGVHLAEKLLLEYIFLTVRAVSGSLVTLTVQSEGSEPPIICVVAPRQDENHP
jgi:hypothetical protein